MIAVEELGELALRFAIPIDVDRRALIERLRALPGVVDAHVSETHACVSFEDEPPAIDASILGGMAGTSPGRPPREHVVRVAYDGADLDEVATLAGLDRESLIAQHAGIDMTVSFVGFMPGFGYLRGLGERLVAIPRRDVPRSRVAAGSVAIAGGFAGIYPFDSPGGWRLLGRALDWTPLDGDAPRLAVGDRVRFERVG